MTDFTSGRLKAVFETKAEVIGAAIAITLRRVLVENFMVDFLQKNLEILE